MVHGVTASFYVPVLDCADDVARVRRAEHDLDLIPLVVVFVEESHVQAASAGDGTLPVENSNIAKSKERRVLADPVVKPSLIELRMFTEADFFVSCECQGCNGSSPNCEPLP